MSTLKGAFTLILLTTHTTLWCVPLYALGIVRLLTPSASFRDALARPMTGIIDGWVSTNRVLFRAMRTNRARVRWETDDPFSKDQWYVVISNHQGWSDILILQDVMLGKVPPLKFFVKQQLLWVPLLGVAMWFLDFPYVRRYSRDQIAANPELRTRDVEAVQAACQHFRRAPTSVLNFLEGTRFTSEKHARQDSPYRHLLTPKVGGIQNVLADLGDRVDRIIDVTIVYPGDAPSFWDYLCGRTEVPVVEIRSHPATVLSPTTEGETDEHRHRVRTWIHDLWSHKDGRIRHLADSRTDLREESRAESRTGPR